VMSDNFVKQHGVLNKINIIILIPILTDRSLHTQVQWIKPKKRCHSLIHSFETQRPFEPGLTAKGERNHYSVLLLLPDKQRVTNRQINRARLFNHPKRFATATACTCPR